MDSPQYFGEPTAPPLSLSPQPSNLFPAVPPGVYPPAYGALPPQPPQYDRPIRIVIVSATVEKGGIGGFATYQIQGSDREGQFECTRRYKEFASLRGYMRRKWVGLYVPLLPEKRITVLTTQGNTDLVFIDTRKRMLEAFCQRVAQYQFMYYSEEFQMFLRAKGSFKTELQKLPLPNLLALKQIYDELFLAALDRDPSAELSKFTIDINTLLGKVRRMKAECSTVSSHAAVVILESAKLAERIQALEKNCLEVMCPGVKTGFFDKEPNAEAENPFKALYFWLMKEETELMAMQECTSNRNFLLAQLTSLRRAKQSHETELSGLRAGQKMSLAAIFSFKSRPKRIAELEAKIKNEESNIQHMEGILLRVDCWLVGVELNSFKQARVQSYVSALHLFCDVLLKEYRELARLYELMASK